MSGAPESGDIHPIARRLRFLEAPGFPRRLMLALLAAFVVLAGFDIVHHRHALFTWEGLWGFHALYGLGAFTFVVLMGWPLRAVLTRPETYYGEGDEDA
jgi:hypothetical protein